MLSQPESPNLTGGTLKNESPAEPGQFSQVSPLLNRMPNLWNLR